MWMSFKKQMPKLVFGIVLKSVFPWLTVNWRIVKKDDSLILILLI